MWTALLILGGLIILAMTAYAIRLLLAVRKQNQALQNVRATRTERLKESIVIIAKAMQNGDCNHSEGVI